MSESTSQPPVGLGGTVRPRDYTAIVYFHGIGTPRRHEEISRLADSLDQYAEKQDFASIGRLRKIDVQWEIARAGNREDIAFVEMTRIVQRFKTKTGGKGNYWQEGNFRLYEGYWSSALAGGFSAWRVIVWFLARFPIPFKILLTPWRTHQRLRLTSLYRLLQKSAPTTPIQTSKRLEELYKQFEGWPARKEYPRGSFDEFLRHLEKRQKNPSTRLQLLSLAKQWKSKFIGEQIYASFVSLTMLATLSAIAIVMLRTTASVTLAYSALSHPPNLLRKTAFLGPEWLALLLTAILIPVLYQLRHYIRYFLADVMFWTMHEEKDKRYEKRTEVVDAAENVLLHVLRDDNCSRVVVVGHSLGSAIAYNALIRLGRRELAQQGAADNRVTLKLNRISHFITLGSPIDIIHYLFDLHKSRYHRFNRIQERLQGSISDPPFQIDRKANTAWINIWDDGDPISGPLFSPRKNIPNEDDITDILSRSSIWPNPLSAHLNYLASETAMRAIFWIGIIGRLPSAPLKKSDWEKWIARMRIVAKLSAATMAWISLAVVLGILSWLILAILVFVCVLAWFATRYLNEKIELVFERALKS